MIGRVLCRLHLHRWSRWNFCGVTDRGRLLEMRVCQREDCGEMETRYALNEAA